MIPAVIYGMGIGEFKASITSRDMAAVDQGYRSWPTVHMYLLTSLQH